MDVWKLCFNASDEFQGVVVGVGGWRCSRQNRDGSLSSVIPLLNIDLILMKWRDHIHTDPAIRQGKPVIKGTRLGVDFILSLLAEGWTTDQVLESYPQLTREHLLAVFAFAAEMLHDDSYYAAHLSTA